MTRTSKYRIPQDIAARLVDPAVYATDRLLDTYAWLRANQPLGIAEVEGFDPFWVVTKYDDVIEISRDNRLFPYGGRPSTLMDKAGAAFAASVAGAAMPMTLIQMDPPEHMKYRLLTQSWFMPASLKQRAAQIREIARKAVRTMAAMGGSGDFVAGVALNYPLEVIMNILGVPSEDFPFMLKVTQEIFGPLDPDVKAMLADMSNDDISTIQQAVIMELAHYFQGLTRLRREQPADDLASLLVNAQVDGKPISDNALNGYYLIVATAGHDTTSSSTSTGMWALATQPGLLERLRADLSLLPAFIEETIRWTTPVKTFMRSAAQATAIRGRTIGQGDWLMLCYASANRDGERIEDPDSFRIDRNPNRHAAFGYGPHLCLGQYLVRMEMQILFEELLPKLTAVRLAGEPALTESFFVNGLKKLPIEFEMAG